MAKKKFYVVWEGRKIGIFETWDECKESIHGFNGAKYKSFQSLELAKQAYSEEYDNYKGKTFFESELSEEELKLIGAPILKSISVDAACSGNPGLMEYQGVETETKRVIFKQGPFKDASNNMGEFLALVHALAHMKKSNDIRPIYSDSKIAISWIRDKTSRSNIQETENNKEVFELMERAEKWLISNEFTNKILKWETKAWGEIPADFGRK
ncbi:ribonuclease H [Flavobacterium sp. WLB]|uniref:Ribonuclease H n=1 Tax=Flavobacterium panici TaxID=2654843 RepID=A0A9N8J299_9FLAO|nr:MULTISPECIES: ribonuclease H family protein [Flavobacterium]KOP35981.1 ribonuclease H [Flavobacterium sp. VMW]OWU88893.1 ribonuclease H [Flavobacterium sp. NLM]PUU69678.1 ribonuclease H [Flavobacterium sp. WLB]UUF14220.1 ribonuclease H family protein [Flavobacterium panici]CAC9974946.1 Ribonuclease H [Flavobacterium panici]